jgi:hypothetical protein
MKKSVFIFLATIICGISTLSAQQEEKCRTGKICFKVVGEEIFCWEVEICDISSSKIPKEINLDVGGMENGISLQSDTAPNGRYILKEDAKLKMKGEVFTLRKGTEWKIEKGKGFIMWDK